LSKKAASYISTWYLTVIIATFAAAIAIFIIPQDGYPWAYIRNILGLTLVFFLPGYTFTRIFFPAKTLLKTDSKSLDTIERVVLSIAVSIALTTSIGVIMYFTPLGIGFIPVTFILLLLTAVFATIARTREIPK
jgi:uncharacterized membrane protein